MLKDGLLSLFVNVNDVGGDIGLTALNLKGNLFTAASAWLTVQAKTFDCQVGPDAKKASLGNKVLSYLLNSE